MAFHQATPIPQRQVHSYVDDARDATPTHHKFDNDSREWGIFSPLRPNVWTEAAEQKARTTGQSKISDFGSLNTIAISGQGEEEECSEVLEDDEELDSLDDGLHAFQDPSYQGSRPPDQSGGSILPAHDGLGTFAPSSFPVQQHLWSFERHNPHRRIAEQQRNWSVPKRLDSLDAENGSQMESARLERIEKWRLEQSMILLEEVEKETRRRRLSRVINLEREEVAALASRDADGDGAENPNASAVERPSTTTPEDSGVEEESFWQRITRHVIRDLIGIDDSLLSVIFGESLPSEGPAESVFDTASPRLAQELPSEANPNMESPSDWEDQLLNRLAHELGILVNQLSERTTRTNTYQNPLTMDYAGMPIAQNSIRNARATLPFTIGTNASSSFPAFRPTLQDHINSAAESEHAAGWGIEGEEEEHFSRTPTQGADSFPRSLHLRAILNYLQRRFIGYRQPSLSSAKQSTSITNNPDSLRRAAIIHQHHPLVSRTYTRAPQNSSTFRQTYEPPTSLSFKRPGSTCASQSTKKSRRNLSGSSSRHYWDIGASLGNGSVIAGSTGIGAWGEV
ncbi:MAG: hypothetical protein MMC33_002697 [Icmadophila ericetorum]|nr:hypothetical protein [Icmadophila ericetorum]